MRVISREQRLQWRQNARARGQNPSGSAAQQREWHLRKSYGLTTELFNQMFENQEGLCGVCSVLMHNGRTHDMRKACVDHDHETSKVRGLLCLKCNLALGYLNHTPQLLQNAAGYLAAA